MSISRLDFKAGCGIRLYRFLIIAFLSTMLISFNGFLPPNNAFSKKIENISICDWISYIPLESNATSLHMI